MNKKRPGLTICLLLLGTFVGIACGGRTILGAFMDVPERNVIGEWASSTGTRLIFNEASQFSAVGLRPLTELGLPSSGEGAWEVIETGVLTKKVQLRFSGQKSTFIFLDTGRTWRGNLELYYWISDPDIAENRVTLTKQG